MSSNHSNPKKSTGQYHSVKGNVVEGIGNLTGQRKWQESGKREHAHGEAEYNAARAKGYTEGTRDRAGGYKDSVTGAITGDASKQTHGTVRKEQGAKEQEFNRRA